MLSQAGLGPRDWRVLAGRIAPMSVFQILFQVDTEVLPQLAQQRLIKVRAALILGEWFGILLLVLLLHARLPLLSLALVLILHSVLNGIAWLRLRAGGAALSEVSLQLLVDAACIGALVYLTGGYANPFISLLLVPLILAAVTLPALHAWVMALWVGGLYTLLMRFYQPLRIEVSPEVAVDMHLSGMWLNFLLTAALVAAFAGRQAATLRRRDAELAEAREQRLRDEQLFALGLQAATAAHDLATPMASVRITLDELRRDYAGDDELHQPFELLSGQVARMQTVLDRLGDSARARGGRSGPPIAARLWLARVLEHWGLMWPQVRVALEFDDGLTQAAPLLEENPALEAVLLVLLNNAAQASPDAVLLRACQRDAQLVVEVIDHGGGLQSGKHAGWGVGLDLARAALERIGGHLEIGAAAEGGVNARVVVPLGGALA
jgi:two-component system, sensor histidine kinase RegB